VGFGVGVGVGVGVGDFAGAGVAAGFGLALRLRVVGAAPDDTVALVRSVGFVRTHASLQLARALSSPLQVD
jgi:hypothetical protein